MASKLYHAIVGAGLVMGQGLAACGGETIGEASLAPDVGPEAASPPVSVPGPTQPDAALPRPLDAARDVVLDAFCDAAWPTTKGSPRPSSCIDPSGACASQGPPSRCYPSPGPLQCEDTHHPTAQLCESGAWVCPTGTIKDRDCQCFGPTPPGEECTPDGFRPTQ